MRIGFSLIAAAWVKLLVFSAWADAQSEWDTSLFLSLPKTGFHQARLISPNILELTFINTKRPDPATVESLDLVTTNYQFQAPPFGDLVALLDGQPASLQSIGFKRRPLYAPLRARDLRIANHLYLRLGTGVSEGQTIEVRNPSGLLWPVDWQIRATADPSRYSPAIHVNQLGYLPTYPKTAMVGYYLGSLGELSVPSTNGFKLVDHKTGAVVFEGALLPRGDVGYQYLPKPYLNVWEADFSNFTTPGEYRLMIPGLGSSWPFRIDEGLAIAFARAYALGLYHQRCGVSLELPYTRFTHGPCHTAAAQVPDKTFAATQRLIADASADYASNARHTAPRLRSVDTSLYPFVNRDRVDVSGGHHDAGDYSKYTINSAILIHTLMFAVDALPGVADLDNLGLPESGDGISDLMQEAKWEADFLAKMQDADGGFYFLVYPRDRAYESDVTPDHGDPQVVWPKNTAGTAAAVAALAQCASSPAFQKQYPATAKIYLAKARQGWTFLTNAIAKYGKDGAYQKLIPYGNEFMHDDELAWAACELFLATGETPFHEQLRAWFDPASLDTLRWGWWRMFEAYGHAIRSYAFAAQTGRVSTNQLDQLYLAKCEKQIMTAGRDVLNRSRSNAYGTSFPLETKRVRTAGWYFSTDQAFDLAVASVLQPNSEAVRCFLYNLNYEAGCNPVNVCYVSGLGLKRQREIVHQYAQNDRRVLPPSGLPVGNIQDQFAFLAPYGGELGKLTFPSDGATTAPYPFYDRWADTFNVTTEFTIVNQARSLASLAFLTAQTYFKNQPWKPTAARILGLPLEVSTNTTVTAALEAPGLNPDQARIVWEATNQEPLFGSSLTFTPTNHALHWVEVEAQWPDGRRVFGAAEFSVTNGLPIVSVSATDPRASEAGLDPGAFTFTRTGNADQPLTVRFTLAGTAARWSDYRASNGTIPESIAFAAGETATTLTFNPVEDSIYEGEETIKLTISANRSYNVGTPADAVITIEDNDPPAPPTIDVQPESRKVLVGDDVTLRVAVSGAAPLRFQWRWNGTDIEGATTESLLLRNVQAVSAGNYSVVVSNLAGSVTSQPASLTVTTPEIRINKPPTISPIPNRKTSMNTPTPALFFFVGDEESAPSQLTVSGRSSNPALVPDENILFNGATASRALVVVPAPNQTGTATITIAVADDQGGSSNTRFELQVYAPDLQIQGYGGELILSWPTNATSYTLEAAGAFGELGQWAPLFVAPFIIGDRYLVVIPNSRAAQFFRLRKTSMD